jgi:predicted TIM-barrel fold metal-dependent hydrolase
MNPFWEDDVYEVIDLMGADHVIFGSDWPHIEGLPRPLDYLSEIQDLDDGDRRLVMRDNVRHLNVLQPVRA